MAILQFKSPAEQVMAKLQLAYPTPHVDSAEEQTENLRIIEQVLKDGVKSEQLETKLKALSQSHGQRLRYKMHTLVVGRFWETSVQQQTITVRGYQPPKAEVMGDKFSMEP